MSQPVVVVTPKLKRTILAAIEATLSTCPDIFGYTETAVERAKRTPRGKLLVKDHTLRANSVDLEFLELMVEIYSSVLKQRQAKLRKEKERSAETSDTASLRKEQRIQAKKQAAHAADMALRKAQPDAAKGTSEVPDEEHSREVAA